MDSHEIPLAGSQKIQDLLAVRFCLSGRCISGTLTEFDCRTLPHRRRRDTPQDCARSRACCSRRLLVQLQNPRLAAPGSACFASCSFPDPFRHPIQFPAGTPRFSALRLFPGCAAFISGKASFEPAAGTPQNGERHLQIAFGTCSTAPGFNPWRRPAAFSGNSSGSARCAREPRASPHARRCKIVRPASYRSDALRIRLPCAHSRPRPTRATGTQILHRVWGRDASIPDVAAGPAFG